MRRKLALPFGSANQLKQSEIPLMPDRSKLMKIAGAAIAIAGGAFTLVAGMSNGASFMIAAGCLIYFAVLLADWWDKG